MKNRLLFPFLILGMFFFKVSTGQVVDLITGLNEPTSLTSKGNDLYVTVTDPAPFGNDKVVKIDVTSTNPSTTDVLLDPSLTEDIVINNNDLYLTEGSSSIYELDLTGTLPANISGTPTIGGFNFNGASHMAVHNNYLYISEYYADIISRINLSTGIKDTLISSSVEAGYMTVHNNILYFSEPNLGRIGKVDLTSSTPTISNVVTGLTSSDPYGVAVYGGDLYVAYATQIRKVNISATPTASTTLVADLAPFFVYDIEVLNGDLYIAAEDINDNGKISKIALNPTSVVDVDNGSNTRIDVYPNPTTDFVKIGGVGEGVRFKLFDILGAEIQEGVLDSNKSIDMSKMTAGTYFLKVENHAGLSVVKH